MSDIVFKNYFKKIKYFNKFYPAYTSSLKMFEDNDSTYAIILTDQLELYILKYSKDITEVRTKADVFELANGDTIMISQGETNNETNFCDTVVDILIKSNGNYRSIRDEKGFKVLVKSRKAILSSTGTYTAYKFSEFTRSQKDKKNADKIEQADVAVSCSDISRNNEIPGTISTMLDLFFDSVSTIYKRIYEPYYNNSDLYKQFRAAFNEWTEFDLPNQILYSLYETVRNIISNGNSYDPAFDF